LTSKKIGFTIKLFKVEKNSHKGMMNMDFVFQVLRVIMIYILLKRIMWIFLRVVQKSSVSLLQREETVDEETPADHSFEIKPLETVITQCCEKVLNKEKAYQVVTKEDTAHYFCSWDCREKFINDLRQTV